MSTIKDTEELLCVMTCAQMLHSLYSYFGNSKYRQEFTNFSIHIPKGFMLDRCIILKQKFSY